jgi:dolichol-phosphate mannosyltransferase
MEARCALHVLVPMLNEAANVPTLVASMRRMAAALPPHISVRFLVVDDGSTDGTGETVIRLSEGLDFTVLRHDQPLGPGRAFATLFAHLDRHVSSDDYVATMEGDNTSRLELLTAMFVRMREGYDVILASPYVYGGAIEHTTAWRVILSRVANVFVKEVLGLTGLATVSSFYRLYRGSVILRLQRCYGPGIIERAGFECMVELLLKMVYLRTSISEVPMTLDTALRAGTSKMNVLRTIAGYLSLRRASRRWQEAAALAPRGELAPSAPASSRPDRV